LSGGTANSAEPFPNGQPSPVPAGAGNLVGNIARASFLLQNFVVLARGSAAVIHKCAVGHADLTGFTGKKHCFRHDLLGFSKEFGSILICLGYKYLRNIAL
jgi:hypothetical protein